MNDLLGKEHKIEVMAIFGHCELRSWFEFDGENFIGMGSKKTYDQNGNLVDYSESPTGLVVTMHNAELT